MPRPVRMGHPLPGGVVMAQYDETTEYNSFMQDRFQLEAGIPSGAGLIA